MDLLLATPAAWHLHPRSPLQTTNTTFALLMLTFAFSGQLWVVWSLLLGLALLL